MKSYLIPTLAVGLLVTGAVAQEKPDLTNPKQKNSYAIGVNIASSLKALDVELDPKAVAAGISDVLSNKPALSEQEVQEALMNLQKNAVARRAEKNLKEGETFLAGNAKKEGVKTTASGLQYKVLKSGTGETPKKTDTVKVHYEGKLIDGTVFDSSIKRGEPLTISVGGVIPGWTEALQLMKVGDKWQLFIPSKLAYGENGAGADIGPNSTLIFEVELLGIEKG